MNRKLPMRVRAIGICLASILSGVGLAARAEAATKYDDGGVKGGAIPEAISVYTYNDIVNGRNSNVITQYLRWDSTRRMELIRQADDAYEHEANFSSGHCFGTTGTWHGASTNMPNSYLDTLWGDTPPPWSRAFGSGVSSNLQPGVTYYYSMYTAIATQAGSNCSSATGSKFFIASQDSHRSGSCSNGYEWCVYTDSGWPLDVVPRSAGWTSGTPRHMVTNQLTNDSFESSVTGWNRWWPAGGFANWALYSEDAYEGSTRLDFNCAGTIAGCAVHQDVPFPVSGTNLMYYEAVFKCRSGTSCPISIALWALGTNAAEPVSENVSIPNDGNWYRARLRAGGYAPNSSWRFQVYNKSSTNTVSIDMALLHFSDTSSAPSW